MTKADPSTPRPVRPPSTDRAPVRAHRQGSGGAADAPNLKSQPAQVGQPLTFGELIDLFVVSCPDKCHDTKGVLAKWREWFQLEDVSAWAVTREQLAAGADYLRDHKGYAISSVNRQLSALGTCYRYAITKRLCPAGFVSPTIGAGRKAEPMRVVEPPRPGEWEHIRRLARGFKDQRFTMFVWLVMDTGARRSEIALRTWHDFDLDDEGGPCIVLLPEDTKTEKARRLYFSHETAALVRRLRPAPRWRGELAFKSRGVGPNQYRKSWERLRQLAAREGMHLHDLRHMVAADLLKTGKGVSQVSSMLGNSTLVLHKRYGHLDDEAVRAMQADRLGLDDKPGEWQPVTEAKARHAERVADAPAEALAEAQRLQLVAQEAMAAALAAAQALAGMRAPPAVAQPRAPLDHLLPRDDA